MPVAPDPRLPIGPLKEHLLWYFGRARWAKTQDGGIKVVNRIELTVGEVAELLNITARTWYRYQVEGGIPMRRADEFACILDTHIELIWDPDHLDKECAS